LLGVKAAGGCQSYPYIYNNMCKRGATVTLAAAAVARQLYRAKHKHLASHQCHLVTVLLVVVTVYPLYIEQHV
jgi:hypothetical protein